MEDVITAVAEPNLELDVQQAHPSAIGHVTTNFWLYCVPYIPQQLAMHGTVLNFILDVRNNEGHTIKFEIPPEELSSNSGQSD